MAFVGFIVNLIMIIFVFIIIIIIYINWVFVQFNIFQIRVQLGVIFMV